MRLIVTSDLHYNVARSKAPTERIAREVCGLWKDGRADALLLVGDTASTDLAILEQALRLFEEFEGPKMAVAGNHELWSSPGEDSLGRYERRLAEVCRRCGVHFLDESPLRLDGVAFVGNVGWYDFSFRSTMLKVPLRFYQHKVGPGAAAYFEKHRHLVEGATDVGFLAGQVTTRWMDGVHVRLPMGDVEFTERLVQKLRRHLNEVHGDAEKVVAAVHHLPFAEVVPKSVIPNWAFANAYMGSELFGEVLLEFPKVSHVFCGHSHRALSCRKGPLRCQSIGSTYREKQYEIADL